QKVVQAESVVAEVVAEVAAEAAAAKLAAEVEAEAAAAEAVAEVVAENLSGAVVLGERLGSGRSGTVYSGLAAGRPVAVKVADADADAEIIHELRSEVEVYQHLTELQGGDIPRLIDHGLLEVDGTLRPALVQEQISNWAGADYPEEDQPEMLPLSVRQSAMDTLDRLHARGVVHGDPRMDNLLFEPGNTPGFVPYSPLSLSLLSPLLDLPLKPRFVDFAFSEIGAGKEAQEEDRKGWLRVLKLPESR
ncbi:hypothetical protein GGF49_005358, partial [Coemansia sp. RSA 1853]